jgi:hypothetical protein
MTNGPNGCLAAILALFGIRLGGPAEAELPYRQRDDFLSAAEVSFYRVLVNAIGSRAVVLAKVNLADIFFIVRPNENRSHRNRIDRKHVDFLLCDPATMKPLCAVELDDSSHGRRDRQDRDEFVDAVFSVAGLPLVRVPARVAYNPAELLGLIEPHLSRGAAVPRVATAIPICPKCNVPMVERIAKKGASAGQKFFGCPNYPRCKELVATPVRS